MSRRPTAAGEPPKDRHLLPKVRACGVIVFRDGPDKAFLLMRHTHRYDLPKGHLEAGEDDHQCAMRECWEETGIPAEALIIDPTFRYEEVYYPIEARFGPGRVEKTLVIFLGWLQQDLPIKLTEHTGYEWRIWRPPHSIQRYTIDPLLAALEQHFAQATG